MGLTGSYIGIVYAAFLLSIASASIALLIGSLADDARRAIELSPLILVPQVFFAGFFVPMSEVPAVLSWGQYLCALKYGINIAFISEFSHFYPVGAAALIANDINTDLQWLYALILVILTIGFRILAILALKRRAKQIY
jgi:ABC-type multidrug transport system permease subunit